jgi:hypothetical protein
MRTIRLLFLLFHGLGTLAVSAQEKAPLFDPDVQKPSVLLVHTGASLQFTSYNGSLHVVTMCVERPITHYHQIGLFVGSYIPEPLSDYNDRSVRQSGGSVEVGVVFKYFPRGVLTGRKSGFYIGPDMRWSSRKMEESDGFFPPTGRPVLFSERGTKLMVNIGRQRQIRNFVLEWSFPLGFERVSSKDAPNYTNDTGIVLAPSLSMGWAFGAVTGGRRRKGKY